MSRRLYFLVPDVQTCTAIVEEIKSLGIPESHTHVVSGGATPLDGLHKASFLQTTEFTHGIEEGLGVGAVAGLAGGLLFVAFPPAGMALGGIGILLITLAGALFGALVSALVAKDIPSRKLRVFQDAIGRGELLLIVDVPRSRARSVMGVVREHHPTAEIGVARGPRPGSGSTSASGA